MTDVGAFLRGRSPARGPLAYELRRWAADGPPGAPWRTFARGEAAAPGEALLAQVAAELAAPAPGDLAPGDLVQVRLATTDATPWFVRDDGLPARLPPFGMGLPPLLRAWLAEHAPFDWRRAWTRCPRADWLLALVDGAGAPLAPAFTALFAEALAARPDLAVAPWSPAALGRLPGEPGARHARLREIGDAARAAEAVADDGGDEEVRLLAAATAWAADALAAPGARRRGGAAAPHLLVPAEVVGSRVQAAYYAAALLGASSTAGMDAADRARARVEAAQPDLVRAALPLGAVLRAATEPRPGGGAP